MVIVEILSTWLCKKEERPLYICQQIRVCVCVCNDLGSVPMAPKSPSQIYGYITRILLLDLQKSLKGP